jgi:hypothetical protein
MDTAQFTAFVHTIREMDDSTLERFVRLSAAAFDDAAYEADEDCVPEPTFAEWYAERLTWYCAIPQGQRADMYEKWYALGHDTPDTWFTCFLQEMRDQGLAEEDLHIRQHYANVEKCQALQPTLSTQPGVAGRKTP